MHSIKSKFLMSAYTHVSGNVSGNVSWNKDLIVDSLMELLSTWVHEICPRCSTLYIYGKWFSFTHANCLLTFWLASKYVWSIFASVDSLKCCTAVESWSTVKLCEYYNYVSCISSKLVGVEQTVWKCACSSKNIFYVPLFSALNF